MSKDKLTPEKIVELLGVKKDSVLYDEVYSLACTLLDSRGYLIHSDEEDTIEVQIEKIFGLVTKKEYEKARKKKNMYITEQFLQKMELLNLRLHLIVEKSKRMAS